MSSFVETPDWSSIPAPADDGAADHLPGLRLPSILLPATDGRAVDLSALPGLVVVYAYPRTGVPDQPNPDGWDAIPGARGLFAAVVRLPRPLRRAAAARGQSGVWPVYPRH